MRKYFFRFHQVYYLIQSFLHFSNFFLFQKFWKAKYFELQLLYCYSNQIQIFLSLNENFKMKVLKLFLYLILSPTYQNYSRLIFKKNLLIIPHLDFHFFSTILCFLFFHLNFKKINYFFQFSNFDLVMFF